MTVELDVYQTIGLVITIAGSIFGAGKAFFGRVESSMRERDDGLKSEICKLGDSIDKEADTVKKLEREMMELKVQLPEKYLTREDYNRHYTVIDAKLDKLYDLMAKQNKA